MLDGQSVVREIQGETNIATYLTGPRGIEYRRDDDTGDVSWYLYDGLGSVVSEVDEDGNITATRKYDVYGAVQGSTGTATGDHKFVGGLGHRTESETGGLTYMGARYYDSALGRFISEDPARDGVNWFIYCENNPVNLVDTDGNLTTAVAAAWIAVKAASATIFGAILAYELLIQFYQDMDPDYQPNRISFYITGPMLALGGGAALAKASLENGTKYLVSQAAYRSSTSLYATVGLLMGVITGATMAMVDYLTSPAACK